MPHIWAGQVLLPMVVKHNSAPLVAPWLPVLMFLLLLASASANHDRPPQKDFKASFRRLRYKRENSHPMWTARPGTQIPFLISFFFTLVISLFL